MNILISNDHAGTELKKEIVEYIKAKGHSVKNYGDDSGESVDYPDFIHPLAKQVSENNEQNRHHNLWIWKWSKHGCKQIQRSKSRNMLE